MYRSSGTGLRLLPLMDGIPGVYSDKCSATETDGPCDRQVHHCRCQIAVQGYRLLLTPQKLSNLEGAENRTLGGSIRFPARTHDVRMNVGAIRSNSHV
jgi:hypothetical protein